MTIDIFSDVLLARALEQGFQAAEVYVQDGESLRVSVYKGKVEDYSVSGTLGLGFRALLNGRIGYAYTQAFDEESVDFLLKSARESALLIENDDPQFIYEGDATYPQVDSFNPELDAVDARAKIERGMDIEKAVFALRDAGAPVDQCTINVSTGKGSVRIRNTRGLNVSHRGNHAVASAEVIAKKGELVNSSYSYRASPRFEELDAQVIAKEAVDEAARMLGAKTVASGNYKVVLRNDMSVAMLYAFWSCFSADAAQKGFSLLKDKEGQVIASEAVTLVDNPLLKGGFASSPFDDEGVATFEKRVIEGGTLKTLLHNLKTAAKAGGKTTANANRASFSATVGVAPSNFYFEKGDISRDALLEECGDGLFITELEGLHSGANAITGDFSLAAKGFRILNGKLDHPVEQITVAGNYFELLKNIVRFADDMRFEAGSVALGSASALVSELSVAGG